MIDDTESDCEAFVHAWYLVTLLVFWRTIVSDISSLLPHGLTYCMKFKSGEHVFSDALSTPPRNPDRVILPAHRLRTFQS